MGPTIFLHEDLYRQIEIIPEENYFATHKYIEEDLPEKELEGYGFKYCVQRVEEPIKIILKHIALDSLDKLFSPSAYVYSDEIKAGYSNTSYKIENCVCWGFERYGVFAEFVGDDNVCSLWLCNSHKFNPSNTGAKLLEVLVQLGINYQLILVDWNLEVTVKLSSVGKVKAYLINELKFNVT